MSDEETISIIKHKIKTNTPFALTRFGDGEIFILNRNASQSFLKKNLNEWGYEYPKDIEKFYDDANKVIRKSFVESDIIGLMNSRCDIVNIGYTEQVWSLNKDLAISFGVDISELQICNQMISRTFSLGSVQGFKDIIQGKNFNIISTNVDKIKTKNLEHRFGVDIGYTNHTKDINFNNRDEFIYNFKNIEEGIVVMGVGLQKDYGVILRDEYGKIVLDMGATMDAWAGIHSRGWFHRGGSQHYLMA
jgi:hypothetical protein